MNWLTKILNRGKTKPDDPFRGLHLVPQRYVPPDLQLTPDEQLSLSAVYGCVRVISEAIASSPWNVYVRTGERREELPDDPIAWILNVQPNPETTAQPFKEALLVQALVYGNAYAEIVRDAAGRVVELWGLPSDRVDVMRDLTGRLIYVFRQQDGGTVVLDPAEVFHLRAMSSATGLLGDSVVGRAAKSVAVAHAAERFALNYYANNASVGGILKAPRNLKPEEEDALQRSWEAGRGGVKNAHRTAVLPPGMDFVPTSSNADQAQVIPARQFSVEEVLRFFGVPPHLVGIAISAQGYGRNLAELGLTFTRHTLRPWTRRLEQQANTKLFPQRAPWRFTEIDVSWLAEGDAMAQAQANEVLFRNGVISKNEWRERLGMNDIGPEGDEYDGKADSSQDEASEPPTGPSEPTDQEDQGDTAPGDTGPSDVTEGDVAARAVRHLIADRLQRHVRRLQAREADLKKAHSNGVLADKLALARTELRDRALKEMHATDDLVRAVAQHAVDVDAHYQAAIQAAETGDTDRITDALVVALMGDRS